MDCEKFMNNEPNKNLNKILFISTMEWFFFIFSEVPQKCLLSLSLACFAQNCNVWKQTNIWINSQYPYFCFLFSQACFGWKAIKKCVKIHKEDFLRKIFIQFSFVSCLCVLFHNSLISPRCVHWNLNKIYIFIPSSSFSSSSSLKFHPRQTKLSEWATVNE
jgi:hypothetical protein